MTHLCKNTMTAMLFEKLCYSYLIFKSNYHIMSEIRHEKYSHPFRVKIILREHIQVKLKLQNLKVLKSFMPLNNRCLRKIKASLHW